MQAYGTLTIVDLLDTATYIYYADNAEGDNPSATSEGKTHIGIYSGPALSSRPDTPKPEWDSDVWSGWQKYVGKDGADGILYDIQTNHEKIYKFFSSSDSTTFSPESISFKAYKTENGKNSLMHPNSDYDTDIALAGHGDNDNFNHLWYFLKKLTGQKNK